MTSSPFPSSLTSLVLHHQQEHHGLLRPFSLVIRDDDDQKKNHNSNNNCFVRLSQTVAMELYSDACHKLLHEELPALFPPNIESSKQEKMMIDKTTAIWNVNLPEEEGDDDDSLHEIEFLPLKVTLPTRNDGNDDDEACTTIYASYNGGNVENDEILSATTDNNYPIIEMPQSLLATTVVDDNNDDSPKNPNNKSYVVLVQVLPWIYIGSYVELEPLSVEDWELMEVHATWLENGGLLQQISVIYPNQIITLRFNNNNNNDASFRRETDVAHLKVLQVKSRCPPPPPPPSNGLYEEGTDIMFETWPNNDYDDTPGDDRGDEDDDDDVNNTAMKSSNVPVGPSCILLVQDTEVIIAPKPRPRPTRRVTPPLRLVPSTADWGSVLYDLAADKEDLDQGLSQSGKTSSCTSAMDVPRGCILVHQTICTSLNSNITKSKEKDKEEYQWAWVFPNELSSSLSPSNNTDPSSPNAASAALVRVISTTSLTPSDAVLHPFIRFQLGDDGGLSCYWDSVRLEFLSQSELSTRIHCFDALRSSCGDDQLCLERVRIETDSPRSSSWWSQEWHRPDCCSTISRKWGDGIPQMPLMLDSLDNESEILLQVGSLFEMSHIDGCSSSSSKNSNSHYSTYSWGERCVIYRLVRRNEQNILQDYRSGKTQDIIAFSKEDLSMLYKKMESMSDEVLGNVYNPSNVAPSPLFTPTMDVMVNLVPDILFLPPSSATTWTGNEGLDNELLLDLDYHRTTATIICGRCGSGKTHTALLVAAVSRIRPPHRATLYLDCKRLQQSSLPLSEMILQLHRTFERAIQAQPCTIVLDDLDKLTPNLLPDGNLGDNNSASRVESASPVALDQSKLIADYLLLLMQGSHHIGKSSNSTIGGMPSSATSPSVSLVLTCESVESLHPDLLRSVGESRIIQVPLLNPKERYTLLGKMIRSGVSLEEWESSVDPTRIARLSEGFRPRDLEKLASRVLRSRLIKRNLSPEESVMDALQDFIPLSHASLANSGQRTGSGPSWESLGGLFLVKAKLSATVLHPAKYQRIYAKATIRLPRGVLLFGPPGCGKSAVVPALAHACNFPLIVCNGPSVLDKYIGASEAKVRELFARAADVAPSILFLDELDSLAPRRGSDHTGVTDRVVNQLLTFLDGVEDMATSGTVYVLAATSRPDKVDPALLRPGRLEQHIFVGHPETEEEWADLFCTMAKNWNLSTQCQQAIASEEFVREILNTIPQSRSFSPADFKAVLDTAHVAAVHTALTTVPSPADLHEVVIELAEIQEAFSTTRPCLSRDDGLVLEEVYRAFRKDDINAFDSRKERFGAEKTLKTTLR